MNYRSTGSVMFAAVAALAGACGGGGGGSGGGGGTRVLAGKGLLWLNQQRVPTSSDLRVVRFAGSKVGLVAGEATNFLRTDNGGGAWLQLEHTPKNGGGDVAGLDFDANRVRAVGSDTGGGKFWDSDDTLEWDTAAPPGTGLAYVAVDVERGFVAPNYAVSFRLRSDGNIDVTDAPENPAPTPVTVDSGIGGAAHCIEIVGAGLAFWYVGGANAGGTGGEIRRSGDNGSNWGTETLPGGGNGIIRDFFFVDGDEGVACGNNSTVIRRSVAGGSTWADISGNLPGGLTLRGIFFPNSEIGWVVGDGGNVWKTSDGGTTWTQQAAGLTTEDLYDVWFVSTKVGYAVGDHGMVLKTTNGSTWTVVTEGDLVQFNAVDFTPDGLRGIAVGNDLGGIPSIYRTLDGGLHWTPFNLGAPLNTDFYGVSIPKAGSGNVAYVCGQSGTILRNRGIGGGGSWELMASNAGANTLRAILFPDDNDNGVCVGDGTSIVYTVDGTSNPAWTVAATKPAADYKTLTHVRDTLNNIRVYAGGTAGVVVQATTFPSPTIWTALPVPAATTIQALSGVDDPVGVPDVLFAAGANQSLYKITVGAGAWSTAPPASASSVAANGLVFTSLLNGWWVSDQIYTTIDGGATWIVSPDHTKATLRAIWVDAAGMISYAAGDDGTILKSLTGGK